MSFFNWFKRTTAPALRQPSSVSARTHTEATTQRPPIVTTEVAQQHRNERLERRELLYSVVRDAMVRAGVLSASYKFKVLALDQRGLQFLVMMDLAREYGGETVRLSDIEGLIAQTAKTRHAISVTAVYWRIDDHIAATAAQRAAASGTASLSLAPPRPLQRQDTASALVARPAADNTTAPAAPDLPEARSSIRSATPVPGSDEPLGSPRFDPIGAEEVAAFKRALAGATALRAPAADAAKPSAPRRPASGDSQFPDTEMPDDYEPRTRSSSLSHTQYGDL